VTQTKQRKEGNKQWKECLCCLDGSCGIVKEFLLGCAP